MLARHLRFFNRLSHSTPVCRNMSFIKNFLHKEEQNQQPEPPKPAQNPEFINLEDNLKYSQEFTPQVHEGEQAYEVPSTPESKVVGLQDQLNIELDLPYKLYGSQAKTEVKTGFMGDRIFTQHKIPKDFVLSHLNKIYTGALYSIAGRDEEFLNEYLEKYFCERLLQSLGTLSKKGYMIKAVKDVTGHRGEPINSENTVIDMIMVRGLSVVRDENGPESSYHKYVDIEDMGLVIYTPHEIQDPANFIDPEKNKTMYDDQKKVLLRMLVEFQSPLKLVIVRPNGEEIAVDSNLNTFKHTAVFETQMKAPPKFTNINKLENYMEWLGKFKFGVWKLADIDNWMLGNPLILSQPTRDLYKDKVFKGSKYDVESYIDLKKV